jgi:DNA-binding IclR family transcriptional regulator
VADTDSSSGEDVLAALGAARINGVPGVTIKHLSQATGRDRKLVTRILEDLVNLHLVEAHKGHRTFALSWDLRTLAAQVVDRRLGVLGQETVDRLSKQTRESAYLVVRQGTHSMTIAEAMPDLGVRAASWLGRSRPISRGDAGPILLMDLSTLQIRELLGAEPLPPVTGRKAPRTVAGLIRLVDQARRQGWCVLTDQAEANVSSVSAPVMGFERDLRGALVVVGPSPRITQRVDELRRLVVDAAGFLSKSLGGQPFIGGAS